MKIISPNYIYTNDTLYENLSIAFKNKIKEIAPFDELIKKYPDAQTITLDENSLIMPGLINAHVHLEFSANKTHLHYGDFIKWLYSVIQNRDELINSCETSCMKDAINMMLNSGITTFGAISSHGMDMDACAEAPQNVVFFNELLGSQANMADALFADFESRLDSSKNITRNGFYPAIAIHSPYSVHPVLIKKALQIASNENLRLTAHFMESEAERKWLDESDGSFKEFFSTLLNQNSSISSAGEFLKHFQNKNILLTHVVKANEKELDAIASNNHTVIHCPISNRLLGNGAINLDALNKKNINWVVATDGLSSNYTLDLFEEMKIALFMHSNLPLLELAKNLIKAATLNAAKALNIDAGEIAVGKNADMLVIDLENKPNDELAIHLILHKYNISRVYINGQLKKGK